MAVNESRFTQFDEDGHRLPEGMRRIAYDADTQRYTFRDRSGQLYQNAPGEEYGILRPVAAPLAHRRNVTITELPDPALKHWSAHARPAKTFNDILPSGYIATARSPEATSPLRSPTTFVQAAMPKVQGVVDVVRRRATTKRFQKPVWDGAVTRSESVRDEKRRLLDEDWEIVRKEEALDHGRISRSKSEMRPSRYYARK